MDDFLRRPVISTHCGATVQEACEAMIHANVGALIVLDEGRLVGIVSERDVMGRVVAPKLDPTRTPVSSVMTRDVRTADPAVSNESAMEIMDDGGFRHLPLVDASGHVVAVVSMRELLRRKVEELDQTSQSLVDYFAADGPGG